MAFVSRAGQICAVSMALSLAVSAGARAQGPAATAASRGAAQGESQAASSGVVLRGTVSHHDTKEPIAGAKVTLEELSRDAVTGPKGEYAFEAVPTGTYHLRIAAQGFTATRIEVTSGSPLQVRNVELEPELHYSEVLSVSPTGKDVFESYQPTSVLSGQELAVKLEGTLGAVLQTEPGVAQRSFGPGPSRPVIRGLDGDRVLLMENGQRTDDLSSQSGDHGVTINPASASQIEVVRGPATLLYGANAIGGLVNVISETIPTKPAEKTSGSMQADFGTAASDGGGAADVTTGSSKFALHVGGSGRKSSDVSTPIGEIQNTQTRSAFGQVGASAITSKGYFGGSYQYDDMKYGIPLVEAGQTQLTPRKQTFAARAESKGMDGFISSVRATFGVRRYKHDELDGEEIATSFKNNTSDFQLLANTKPVVANLQSTYGVSGYFRSFAATGEEALAPPVDQNSFAAFTYQELPFSHVTLQFGGRVEHASFSPEGGLKPRDFTNGSGSVGLLVRPSEATTIAVSLARAVRNPALEELYFFGPHAGNFAFEIGNDELEAEKALGLDVSFRWRLKRLNGEVTYFRNSIKNFIFRDPTGDEEDGFPVIRFTGGDSVLQGVEAHTDVELTPSWIVELGFDSVRGELTATNDPLPRMPPMRFISGLRYRHNALQLGGDVIAAARQDRVFGAETPTDGYTTLKLFGVYSLQQGSLLHTFTLRLDNATNETYYNHLSFIKDFVPEMGRNFKVVYGIRF